MEDDLRALLHHVAEGVAARGQQVAVLRRIDLRERLLREQPVAEPARLLADVLRVLLPVAERQLPGRLLHGAVAVLAFDLDLGERGPEQVAVAVHVHRGVAVLAEHSAFRVLRAGLHLVVQVVLDEEVVLGMQLGLLPAGRGVGRAVGELHDPLVAHADPLSAVVAGVAGLRGDPRVLDVADLDHRLAGALHAVHQQLPRLLPGDGRIAALVESFVRIGHVAGRTAGPAEVAALLPAGHPDVAALALLARVGDAGEVRMLRDPVGVDLRDLLHLGGHLVRMRRDEGGHVLPVGVGADGGDGAVLVGEVVVAPHDLHALLHAPGPEVALDLPRLGVHQGLGEALGVSPMALAAGLVRDPDRAGVGIEGMRPPGLRQ